MNNVIIGWNPEENIEKWDAFSSALEKVFLAIKTEGFETDPEHIRFAYTCEEIEDLISDCSVLLCSEEIGGNSIGTGTLKKWKEMDSEPLRVIAVLDASRKGGGKCKGFYENGFYDCIFQADFSIKDLFKLMYSPRTKAEAFLYYGLDAYHAEERKKSLSAKDSGKDKKENEKKGAVEPLDEGAGHETDIAPGNGEVPVKEDVAPDASEQGNASPGTADDVASPKKKKRRKRKKKDAASIENNGEELSPEDAREDARETADPIPKEPVPVPKGPAPVPVSTDKETAVPDTHESVEYTVQIPADTDAEPYDNASEPLGYEDNGHSPFNGDMSADSIDVLSASVEDVYGYLRECEKLSKSYVKPVPELSDIDAMVEDLLRYYMVENSSWLTNLKNGTSTREEFEAEVWQRLVMYQDDLSQEQMTQVISDFMRFMWGYDFLEPYILDPNISDIKIYEPQVIMVTVEGENMVISDTFRSDLHYRCFVMRLADRNHVDIQNNAISRFTDTTSYTETRLRVNISTELINSSGYSLVHIRKVNNIKYTANELIDKRMASPWTFAYLVKRIREGASILVCGENASGKTTLSNTLIEYLGLAVPGLFIQESDEVFSYTHPLLQFQQIASDKEFMGDATVGKKYTLAELAKNGLLTKIQFFGIGEMKGEETAYAHTAIDTGSQFIGTTHTSSYKAALMRLVRLAMMSEDMKAFSKEDLLRSFCQINLIVFMEDFQITQLAEVKGYDDDKHEVIYEEVPIVIPEKEHLDKSTLGTYAIGEVTREETVNETEKITENSVFCPEGA